MYLHKFLDPEASERRNYRFKLFLDEHGIESELITQGFEDVEGDEGKTVTLAVLELLKKLRLRLVIQVRVLQMILVP